MSWPSTDCEVEIENELQALRRVAAAARKVVNGRLPAISAELEGSTWKHSRIADSLTDGLYAALATVPEPGHGSEERPPLSLLDEAKLRIEYDVMKIVPCLVCREQIAEICWHCHEEDVDEAAVPEPGRGADDHGAQAHQRASEERFCAEYSPQTETAVPTDHPLVLHAHGEGQASGAADERAAIVTFASDIARRLTVQTGERSMGAADAMYLFVEAIKKGEHTTPDDIVLDMRAPRIDENELEALRHDPRRETSPWRDLLTELVAKCIGDERDEQCIVCGSRHDSDHVEYDGDPSCVVSRVLQAERSVPEPGRTPEEEAVRALEDYAAGNETQIGAISRVAAAIDSTRTQTRTQTESGRGADDYGVQVHQTASEEQAAAAVTRRVQCLPGSRCLACERLGYHIEPETAPGHGPMKAIETCACPKFFGEKTPTLHEMCCPLRGTPDRNEDPR